jgi:hypothetical protein
MNNEKGGSRWRARRGARGWLALALAGGSIGCGSDDDGAPSPEGAGSGPLYLIATFFSAGDNETTYFVTSPTFDASTQIDSTNGPELLGGVVPTVWNGAVFAPDSTAPVLTRFDIGAGDRLERGAELSFAGVGMTQLLSWHVYIASDTKGYVFDPGGSRLIVWNPSQMVLTGEQIPLPMLQRSGWVPNLVFEHSGVVRRGDTLLVPLGWQDQDFNSMYASGVLALNVDTNEVLSIDEDDRCGETYAAIPTPSGDVFFMPPDWSAVPHFFADMHQPTCVSRIVAGQTAFDGGDVLDVSAMGAGLPSSGGVPDGGSGFYFTSLDPALYDGTNAADAVWRVWHHDFASNVSRQVESLPAWGGTLYYVNVGGQYFIPHWEVGPSGTDTTMYGVPDDGSDPAPIFTFAGNWYGAARLR